MLRSYEVIGIIYSLVYILGINVNAQKQTVVLGWQWWSSIKCVIRKLSISLSISSQMDFYLHDCDYTIEAKMDPFGLWER